MSLSGETWTSFQPVQRTQKINVLKRIVAAIRIIVIIITQGNNYITVNTEPGTN